MTDIAIIGHGPSKNGSWLGRFIDAQDCVCRVNPGNRPEPELEPDFGTKTDIVADNASRALKSEGVPIFWPVGVKVFNAAIHNDLEKLSPWFDGFTGKIFMPLQVQLKWHLSFRERRRKGKTKFLSNGMCAIICALEAGFRDIRLYGFDSVQAGNNFTDDQRSVKANHDWETEHEMLPDIVGPYGAEINFAGAT